MSRKNNNNNVEIESMVVSEVQVNPSEILPIDNDDLKFIKENIKSLSYINHATSSLFDEAVKKKFG